MGVRVKSSPVGPLPPGIEERFLEAGGVRFRYLSSAGRTSGAGSVSPILSLHGYPTWAEVWLPLAAGGHRPLRRTPAPAGNRRGQLLGRDPRCDARPRSSGAGGTACGPRCRGIHTDPPEEDRAVVPPLHPPFL